MEKDKITFIDEKTVEKETKKRECQSFRADMNVSNPIKAKLIKFHLNKKKTNFDDLV